MFYKNLYLILMCLYALPAIAMRSAEKLEKHNEHKTQQHQLTSTFAVIKTQLPPELQPSFEELHKKIRTMFIHTPELTIEHPFYVEYLYSNNSAHLVTGMKSDKSLLCCLGLEEHKNTSFVWSLSLKRLLDFETWSENDKKVHTNINNDSLWIQLDNYRFALASGSTVRVVNMQADVDNFTPEQLALSAKLVGYIERGKIPNTEKKHKLLDQAKHLFCDQSQTVYRQRLHDILYPQTISLTEEHQKRGNAMILAIAPFASAIIGAALYAK